MRALYPGPPTREHKSLLNNAIRLDGVVFIYNNLKKNMVAEYNIYTIYG